MDIGSMTKARLKVVLGHKTERKVELGTKMQMIRHSELVLVTVMMRIKPVNVPTPTMEPQTHMETIVTTTLQILPGVACMIQTHSFLVTCAVVVEEVLIVTTRLMVAYGIISMAQLELGLHQVMDHLVSGQEMMVTTVAVGVTMTVTQQ